MIPQYVPSIDRPALAQAVCDYIMGDGFFTEFEKTKEFERELALSLNVAHCHTINNGTISLSIALLAMGIKPGDRVLVPAITMIATCNAIKLIGAEPVVIDVSPVNLCMKLESAKHQIGLDHTIRAVIYVTLNGRSHTSGEMREFNEYCIDRGIALIEDNAQSMGSSASNLWPISCQIYGIGSFSFSMPKIITTGQGGCLVTNNDGLSDAIQRLKDFGRKKGGTDFHDSFGINSKFTEIQAIMGLEQLKDLRQRIVKKKSIYAQYKSELDGVSGVSFIPTENCTAPWFVDIYTKCRDSLAQYLEIEGIKTRPIYLPLPVQPINSEIRATKTPVAAHYSANGLWLPSSLDLCSTDITRICNTIKEFFGSRQC